ncbi:MAG: ABC transporter permease [Phenylobacterium sp.]|jgi:NitT/TauT family transport system permease protein|uniref:ABC transporter permease n=1 Tax=Phenylobacterium sp. TaxID=1871053 RepID=UPI001B70FD06|nr:ABC transporter permease [Phenylobacterium sp.]MBP7648710.1 ABC transporter permease [Phenylobacterium sp.]MBP7817063.1 ABC transporter permease [Phenylobacterium sp.]MBP9232818.1 ABC transporter permease [Phenylobacterium sp.]MBP9753535.1 ABC transporter permease [Phenylobacterium sp.]
MRRLLNARPRVGGRLLLGLLPILALVLLYLVVATARHTENPRDKITPIPAAMAAGIQTMAFEADPRTGEVPLVADTKASLQRLGVAVGLAAATTLVLGLTIGLLPYVRASLGPLVATISVIPPIAVLPILFIVFGLGETSKIVLIFVGITPVMVRDLATHVAAIPEEQIVKAQTLGASTWLTLLRVALPQALPRLIDSLRLSLCPAWVYLISAEAIASDVGLGYRIFLVRRYLAMDIILPYVVWISLLAVIMDLALQAWSRTSFAWAHPPRNAR